VRSDTERSKMGGICDQKIFKIEGVAPSQWKVEMFKTKTKARKGLRGGELLTTDSCFVRQGRTQK